MQMRGIDLVGVEYGGLISSIFNAAGSAVDVAQQSSAEQAAESKAQAAIAADRAATNAVGRANASAEAAKIDKTQAGAAKADKMAADKAVQVQDKAGAAMPADKKDERVKAAQDDLDNAQKALEDALRGNDKAKQTAAQAFVDAATQTLGKAQGVAPEGNTGHGKGTNGTPSMFSKKIVGPVKVWEALVGLLVVVGGAYVWKRK